MCEKYKKCILLFKNRENSVIMVGIIIINAESCMKNNLKYQNRAAQKPKKSRRDSLGWEALFVILINLVCVLILTPIYQGLGGIAYEMSVDVARDGSFLHVLCDTLAGALFYISSFLGTCAFFIGASYMVRFAMRSNAPKLAASSVILYIGMSVSTVVTLLVFLIIRIGDASVTLSDPMTLLYDVLFLLFRVGVIAVAAWLLTRKRVKASVIAILCAVFMFVCAAGLELIENIPFFIKGTMLAEDVTSLVVSMLLYAAHGVLGWFVMMRMMRK